MLAIQSRLPFPLNRHGGVDCLTLRVHVPIEVVGSIFITSVEFCSSTLHKLISCVPN
jgi:hypothetical protein